VTDPIVVHTPKSGAPDQLFLLFHGVGAAPDGLVPLGEYIAAEFPQAAVLSVPAPYQSDFGSGRQWFSVRGVTEENRPARVAEVMPVFASTVRELQARFGLGPEATVLAGFSQGAIMSLESARLGQGLAGRIVSIAGRFSELPERAPANTAIHFLHGQSDGVVLYSYAAAAADKLAQLGAPVTIDVEPFAGHEITQQMARAMVQRLKSPVKSP
jgi:phospholipase/carboxylesterase